MRCPFCDHDNIPGDELCAACGSDLAGLDIPEADEGFMGRLMTDTIRRLPLVPPLSIAPDATVADAISLMRRERHGCVLVQDGERLVGIFTERDVLTRVLRRGIDPAAAAISEVMTPDPLTLTPIDPPAFAIHRMVVEGLRHLPILDGDELLGFISVRGILRYVHRDVIGQNGNAAAG